jgi:hypothetical protein
MGMKYLVTARNLVSFEMGQIIDDADLAARNINADARVASGHLERLGDDDETPRRSKKTSKQTDPESE